MTSPSLATHVERARAEWGNVGLAVAVVRGREVIDAQGFGVRELGGRDRIDADTLFQVGSTSKAFTAAALGMLVDDGQIHWDRAVVDYVPRFRLRDPWLTQKVTMRDVLAHRAGVPDSIFPFLSVTTLHDVVARLAHVEADALFRDSFRYNNSLYAVAGEIIAAITGKSWHDFIRQRLLEPLGMARSGTSALDIWDANAVAPTLFGTAMREPRAADARIGNVAMPHGYSESGELRCIPWQNYDNAAAAGALYSSAADMAKWLILNCDEGQFDGQVLLAPATMRTLHARQNVHFGDHEFMFPLDETTEGYALGWWCSTYHGRRLLSHSGGIIGFPAYMMVLAEAGQRPSLAVVVLSNGGERALDYQFIKSIAFATLDGVLGERTRDWSAEFLQRARQCELRWSARLAALEAARRRDLPSSLPHEQYSGWYEARSAHKDLIHVSQVDGALMLKCRGEGAYRARLEHWHHDLFRLRSSAGIAPVLGYHEPPFASFALGSAGTVDSMLLFGESFKRVTGGS